MYARAAASIAAHCKAATAVLRALHMRSEAVKRAARAACAAQLKRLDDLELEFDADAALLRACAFARCALTPMLLQRANGCTAALIGICAPLPRTVRFGDAAAYRICATRSIVSTFDTWTTHTPSCISITPALADTLRFERALRIRAADVEVYVADAVARDQVCADVHGEPGHWRAYFRLPDTLAAVRIQVRVAGIAMRDWIARRVGLCGVLVSQFQIPAVHGIRLHAMTLSGTRLLLKLKTGYFALDMGSSFLEKDVQYAGCGQIQPPDEVAWYMHRTREGHYRRPVFVPRFICIADIPGQNDAFVCANHHVSRETWTMELGSRVHGKAVQLIRTIVRQPFRYSASAVIRLRVIAGEQVVVLDSSSSQLQLFCMRSGELRHELQLGAHPIAMRPTAQGHLIVLAHDDAALSVLVFI